MRAIHVDQGLPTLLAPFDHALSHAHGREGETTGKKPAFRDYFRIQNEPNFRESTRNTRAQPSRRHPCPPQREKKVKIEWDTVCLKNLFFFRSSLGFVLAQGMYCNDWSRSESGSNYAVHKQSNRKTHSRCPVIRTWPLFRHQTRAVQVLDVAS